ncbi:hypothetical protein Sango_3108000 [Sesamum angolense]|uniref:Reverse transcriptase zinc-binding domain-containing protein n=1 Tax=Sesamum angolense TaxID=2727404 RepID=A0AAE1VY96_9LAMI|nr:hypothetical protein Sango_3108000 [Sesamum angolense]
MLKLRPLLQRGVIYKIGDDSSFSLWQDAWHEVPRGPEGNFKIPRHGFFLWMAILEKLSTMDKPWVPRAENGCVLCGGLFDETHDHLFFKCSYSKRCLSILRRKIRFQWPFLEWQTGLIWASKRWRGTHLINAAFRATLAALVYHLWAERNNRKFSATSASAEYITSRVLDDIRLKVNSAKSQIIFSRAVQQERQQILDYLGFQEGSLPVKYLGIPLTSSRLTIADCRPLIDKVDARLAGWNNQILSYAGWLQLIKSVLTTLHTYWASAFILPKGVLKILEKKMRQFLWQGSAGSRNAKVAWAWISKRKRKEGLRYRLRHSTIWTFNGALGSWGWKKMLKLRPLLQRGVIYKIGDDSSFSLWQDAWHEVPRGPEVTGLPLSSPLSSVIQRNQWCWPASTDTDIIGITSQLPPLHSSAADCISWRSSSGKFTFLAAVSLIQPTTPRVSWYALLQGNFKIPRHGFFLWMAILEKLSTMDKPWVPRAENGRVLCGGLFDETHDHLFFKCSYSKRCLCILRRKIRFQWPFLEWQTGLIWASKRWRGTHLINAAFRATLAALVYHLWAERNNRKFSATSASAEYITSRVLDDIRMQILAAECPPSLQSINLYRIWHLTRLIGL